MTEKKKKKKSYSFPRWSFQKFIDALKLTELKKKKISNIIKGTKLLLIQVFYLLDSKE
jgi:hypothetical protein